MNEQRIILTDESGAELDVERAKAVLGDHFAIRVDSAPEEFEIPAGVPINYKYGDTFADIELLRQGDGRVLESERKVPTGQRIQVMRSLVDRVEAGEFNQYL